MACGLQEFKFSKVLKNVKDCDAMIEVCSSDKGSFTLQGPLQGTRELQKRLKLKVWVCLSLLLRCIVLMPWNNVVDIDNNFHMFLLQLIFILHINFALDEYRQ